jgi:hypothetical protein
VRRSDGHGGPDVHEKCPAMTYFLGPLRTNIIGAEGLTTVFGMGTGVSLPL